MLKQCYDMKGEKKIPITNKSVYITMLSYCFKCRKNIESKHPKLVTTKNGRITAPIKMCSVW